MFHIVVRRTPGTWDALMELVERHELPLITSENRPDDVAPENWCKYVLARRHATGREVAGAVTGALTGDGRAAMALIDELAGGAGLVPKVGKRPGAFACNGPTCVVGGGVLVAGGPPDRLHEAQPAGGAGNRRAAAGRRDPRAGALPEVFGLLRRGAHGIPARPVDGRLLPGRIGSVSPTRACDGSQAGADSCARARG